MSGLTESVDASAGLGGTGRARGSGLAVGLFGLLTAAAINLPLLYIFVRAGSGGMQAHLSVVLAPATFARLAQTVALVLGVVALALAIALPLAWLVVRTDLRGRRIWGLLGALPLVFPSYVSAFALVAVLGPRGFVQGWLEPLGVERLPGVAYGYTGALLALALFTYPYVYLLVVAALRSLDPALEESSSVLGRSRMSTLRHVTLPQLRAPICAGALLVALYVVSDFGAVSIVRYNTLTLSIYDAYRSLFDRSVAASMSTVLVALALALIGIQAFLLRGAPSTRTRPVRPAPPIRLGRWQVVAQASLVVLGLFTLGIPVGVVIYWGVGSLNAAATEGALRIAANSIGVSGVAAFVALALSIPVAAWSVRFPSKLSRASERLSYSGYALPGLVIALALVFLATRHFPTLYQTLGLLVAAYVIRFIPQAISATRSAMADVAPTFEEAGRSLGRGPLAVLGSITLPLIRPGLLAGTGLVFLTTMKELPATLILRPIGFETLATRVWSAASEGVYAEAALPALLLLLASAFPVYWLTIRPALWQRESR